MTGIGFPIFSLVWLYCMLCPCVGKIISPANRTILTGSSENLTWSGINFSTTTSRHWSFIPSDGSGEKKLGFIIRDLNITLQNRDLPGIKIVKPATLSLSNVNQNYSGKYKFTVSIDELHEFFVTVFIAEKSQSTKSATTQSTQSTLPTPTPTPTQSTPTQPAASKTSERNTVNTGGGNGGLGTGAIVGICLGVLVFLVKA